MALCFGLGIVQSLQFPVRINQSISKNAVLLSWEAKSTPAVIFDQSYAREASEPPRDATEYFVRANHSLARARFPSAVAIAT